MPENTSSDLLVEKKKQYFSYYFNIKCYYFSL